jgi:hypothetical protein
MSLRIFATERIETPDRAMTDFGQMKKYADYIIPRSKKYWVI